MKCLKPRIIKATAGDIPSYHQTQHRILGVFCRKCHAEFKPELAEIISENLQALQYRYGALTAKADYVDSALPSELPSWLVAEKTLDTVREKRGSAICNL
jgi:hypothetical protein